MTAAVLAGVAALVAFNLRGALDMLRRGEERGLAVLVAGATLVAVALLLWVVVQ